MEEVQDAMGAMKLAGMPTFDLTAFSGSEEDIAKLNSLVGFVRSGDKSQIIEAVRWFRKLLSIERVPPIDAVIATGIIPDLIRLLSDMDDFSDLQFECAWALTNVASGKSEHTRYVVEQGLAPVLINKTASPNVNVAEQCVWALGNIAGDSTRFRDLLLDLNVVPAFIRTASGPHQQISLFRNTSWAISNLCRGKPQPAFHKVAPLYPVIKRFASMEDSEVICDALWAISYLTDGDNNRIQAALDAGVLPLVVKHLDHPNNPVVNPALRAIGNVVTGDDDQTEAVLNLGALPAIHRLLKDYKNKSKSAIKEVCWAVSNITAGNRRQIQAIIDEGIAKSILDLLANHQSLSREARKEAFWAITNLGSGGSPEQIEWLIENRCVHIYSKCLVDDCEHMPQPELIVVLNGIANFFKYRQDGSDTVEKILEEEGALEKIEELQNNQSQEVYEEAVKILEMCGGEELVDEADNTAV